MTAPSVLADVEELLREAVDGQSEVGPSVDAALRGDTSEEIGADLVAALELLQLEGARVLDAGGGLGGAGRSARHYGAAWVEIYQPDPELAWVARLINAYRGIARVFVLENAGELSGRYDVIVSDAMPHRAALETIPRAADVVVVSREAADSWPGLKEHAVVGRLAVLAGPDAQRWVKQTARRAKWGRAR